MRTVQIDLIDVIDISPIPEQTHLEVVTVLYSTPKNFREREWSFTINLN